MARETLLQVDEVGLSVLPGIPTDARIAIEKEHGEKQSLVLESLAKRLKMTGGMIAKRCTIDQHQVLRQPAFCLVLQCGESERLNCGVDGGVHIQADGFTFVAGL